MTEDQRDWVTIIGGMLVIGLCVAALAVIFAFMLGAWKPVQPEYVVDFGGTIHDPQPIIVVTTCTQQPHNDADLRAYCNLDGRTARIVTPDEWNGYSMGSPVK